jgi:hypothetical protein
MLVVVYSCRKLVINFFHAFFEPKGLSENSIGAKNHDLRFWNKTVKSIEFPLESKGMMAVWRKSLEGGFDTDLRQLYTTLRYGRGQKTSKSQVFD